jgi:hypothetical protein
MARTRRLARILIACCLAGAALEVAARADDWLRYRADPLAYYGSLNLRWVDDRGLTFNRPGVRFEKWRHDARGFRIPPGATGGDAATVGVVCLGTSESYGLYESPGREWPAVLAARLDKAGIRAVNASVVGMSPFQYADYLDNYVLPLRPEKVVLIISPFSFVQGMKGDVPLDSTDFVDPARIGRMRTDCKPTWKACSRFLPKARASIKSRLPEPWLHTASIGLRRLKGMLHHRPPVQAAALTDAPPQRHLVAYTQLMDDLARQLTEHGVAAVFSTYPNSLRLDGTPSAAAGMLGRQHWLPGYSPAGLLAISREFSAVTRAHCDSMGYAMIDLEAVMPKDDATFADSVHLTDAGAALFAEKVLESLEHPAAR